MKASKIFAKLIETNASLLVIECKYINNPFINKDKDTIIVELLEVSNKINSLKEDIQSFREHHGMQSIENELKSKLVDASLQKVSEEADHIIGRINLLIKDVQLKGSCTCTEECLDWHIQTLSKCITQVGKEITSIR